MKRILGIIIALAIVFPSVSGAASRVQYPLFKAFNSSGKLLSGGRIWTYEPGTTTPKATYTGADESVELSNPICLDSLGEKDVFLSGPTKMVLEEPTTGGCSDVNHGVVIWTKDNVLPSTEQSVANISALRLHQGGYDGDIAHLVSHTTDGDDGGGVFRWDADSTETDNGGTVIKVTAITAGRWIREIESGIIKSEYFGLDNTGTSDCSTAYEAMRVAAGAGTILFGKGKFAFDTSVDVPYATEDTAFDYKSGSVLGMGTSDTQLIWRGTGALFEPSVNAFKGEFGNFEIDLGHNANTGVEVGGFKLTQGGGRNTFRDIRFLIDSHVDYSIKLLTTTGGSRNGNRFYRIQDYPILGGAESAGVLVWLNGEDLASRRTNANTIQDCNCGYHSTCFEVDGSQGNLLIGNTYESTGTGIKFYSTVGAGLSEMFANQVIGGYFDSNLSSRIMIDVADTQAGNIATVVGALNINRWDITDANGVGADGNALPRVSVIGGTSRPMLNTDELYIGTNYPYNHSLNKTASKLVFSSDRFTHQNGIGNDLTHHFYNYNDSDGSKANLLFATDTTGVGATGAIGLGSYRYFFDTHDHATRSGRHVWTNAVSGSAAYDRMTLKSGLQLHDSTGVAPTGGDKGAGTINLTGDLYKNNTAYTNPDYVFEHWVTGGIEKYKDNPGASDYQGLMPIDDLMEFVTVNYRFPQISDAPLGAFERGDKSLELTEQLAIYIFQLNQRVKDLESKMAE